MLKSKSANLTDRIYREKQQSVQDFAFNDEVVSVFSDMISRSIPGYDVVTALAGIITAHSLPENGVCYDLGCSLGKSTRAVLDALGDRPCRVVAVDASEPMIRKAREITTDSRVEFRCGDISEIDFGSADVVLLNFTLQFIPPEKRLALLKDIHDALESNGLLVVSEKVKNTQEFNDLHLKFKKFNNYTDLEIAQKRTALENVMQTDTTDQHVHRFLKAGYRNPRIWFQCLNWVSFLANK